MTETRIRTKHGSVLSTIYGIARLQVEDAGRIILNVQDCKEIVQGIRVSNYDSERYGYEKGFQEAMHFVRCKPWYKRIRI